VFFDLLSFLVCYVVWFVSVELKISFYYSHFNFRIGICNEFNDNWHHIIGSFFLFDRVKTLRVNFHKKRRVGQVKILFLKLEVTCIFIYLLSSC
jgi:uncharacterized membrane protein